MHLQKRQQQFNMELWKNEFRKISFAFEGRDALLILPHDDVKTDRLMLKTEYFGAFLDVYKPDIVGVQEVCEKWVTYMPERIGDYKLIGTVRKDGGKRHPYLSSRFGWGLYLRGGRGSARACAPVSCLL